MARTSDRLNVDSHRGLAEWIVLHQAYSAIFQSLELALLPFDFTMPRLHAMGILAAANGPLTVSKLAQHMVRATQSLVRIVDELERVGWVVRSDDPTDRRKKMITMTDEGRKAFGKAFKEAASLGQGYMSRLSDASLAQLRTHLTTLRDAALEGRNRRAIRVPRRA